MRRVTIVISIVRIPLHMASMALLTDVGIGTEATQLHNDAGRC